MLLLDKTSAVQKLLITYDRGRWVTALVFLAAILFTNTIERHNWPLLLVPFTIAMAIYVLAISRAHLRISDIRFWLVVGMAARAILIFSLPNLSDDLYRFIWDGHCTLQGLNPYLIVPSDFIAENGESGYLTTELLANLNSPEYYTVYPPLSQYIFASAAWIGGSNWLVSSIFLKLILLVAEYSTGWMLYKILEKENRAHLTLLYFLNPLVIVELVGNIHFEGIMIWGIVAAYYILLGLPKKNTQNLLKTSIALTASIYVKLIPVLLIPFLWRRLGWSRFFALCGMIGLMILLFALPFINSSAADGPTDSLDLYFHTFEFNAGFYYVFRWLGFLWKDYNMIATIGTATSLLTVALLAALFFFEKKPVIKNWPRIALFALTTYFMLASIVHPWYICGLVALVPFTSFRYPIVWSAMAFLSYSAYRVNPVQENLWLVGLEYVVVIGFLIWEGWRSRGVHCRP